MYCEGTFQTQLETQLIRLQMLFTWSTQDLCIIFRSWHVRNTATLLLSLVAIIAITAGYELVRELSRRYEAAADKQLEDIPRKCLAWPLP